MLEGLGEEERRLGRVHPRLGGLLRHVLLCQVVRAVHYGAVMECMTI